MHLVTLAIALAAAPPHPPPHPHEVAIEHGYHRTGRVETFNRGRHSGACRFEKVRGRDVRVCR